MTDNEIIKALEYCVHNLYKCPECPYNNETVSKCSVKLKFDAIDLINRQQAEIERLLTELDLAKAFYKEKEAEFSLLNYKYNKTLNQLNDYQSIAKTEAIKEFAERLKLKVDIDLCEAIECSDYLYNLPKLIDNIVKEMVGE